METWSPQGPPGVVRVVSVAAGGLAGPTSSQKLWPKIELRCTQSSLQGAGGERAGRRAGGRADGHLCVPAGRAEDAHAGAAPRAGRQVRRHWRCARGARPPQPPPRRPAALAAGLTGLRGAPGPGGRCARRAGCRAVRWRVEGVPPPLCRALAAAMSHSFSGGACTGMHWPIRCTWTA